MVLSDMGHISSLNGIHVPRNKAVMNMKAVATLTYLSAAVQLRCLAPTVPNVVGYRNM
jgi:hypothetical protein